MRIQRTVVVIEAGNPGYDLYVKCNVAGALAPAYESQYSSLRWTELVDVLLGELDGRRPGWEVDEGLLWQQPPLTEI